MASDIVAEFLRSENARIAALWEDEVRHELPDPQAPARPALSEHVPVFLDGLADWVEGETARARQAFASLVEGHALQRLGYGIGLETLIRECSKLRLVLLRETRAFPSSEDVCSSLMRLHEGLDVAMAAALHRYAQRREDVRDRFIGILGHDLRDPLSTVAISATVLAGHPQLVSEHQLVVGRISRACERMQRMIGEVLDFARGHLGGGIPANPARNDMAEICRAAVDELAAAHPDRRIHETSRGDLRGAFDRDRVVQAITNLVRNGLEHGTGDVTVDAHEADDHRAVITSVTSHGNPIPELVLRRIFDPFTAGDPTGPRVGLGLGLYIVQQIALAHGATCEVTSNAEATSFTICWPRAPGAARRVAATG